MFNAESLSRLWVVEIPSTSGEPAQIGFGAVVAAVIQFVLVAVVVYFALVLPINHLKKVSFRKKTEAPPADVPPTEAELLAEIRDLLAHQQRQQPSS